MTGVAIWAIWGGDVFPAESDPKGNPETWTRDELRRWLANVSPQRLLPWDGNHYSLMFQGPD